MFWRARRRVSLVAGKAGIVAVAVAVVVAARRDGM